MLETLLSIMAEGGLHSYDELASRLSISPWLLEAMLADLARLGYLRLAGDGCTAHCSGCSMGGCSAVGPGRLWALTDKGFLAAASREA